MEHSMGHALSALTKYGRSLPGRGGLHQLRNMDQDLEAASASLAFLQSDLELLIAKNA